MAFRQVLGILKNTIKMSSDPVFQIFSRKVKIYYCETLIVVNTSLENIEQCGLFFPCDLIVVIPLFLKKKPDDWEEQNSWEPYLHLSFKAGCSRYIIISRRATALFFAALFWTEEVSLESLSRNRRSHGDFP